MPPVNTKKKSAKVAPTKSSETRRKAEGSKGQQADRSQKHVKHEDRDAAAAKRTTASASEAWSEQAPMESFDENYATIMHWLGSRNRNAEQLITEYERAYEAGLQSSHVQREDTEIAQYEVEPGSDVVFVGSWMQAGALCRRGEALVLDDMSEEVEEDER